MPIDTTALNTALAALTAQVAATVGAEDSAEALIDGFSAQVTKAVADALTADAAANQGSIDAATEAIAQVTGQFKDSSDKLGAAVTANPGGTPPPPPPGGPPPTA